MRSQGIQKHVSSAELAQLVFFFTDILTMTLLITFEHDQITTRNDDENAKRKDKVPKQAAVMMTRH